MYLGTETTNDADRLRCEPDMPHYRYPALHDRLNGRGAVATTLVLVMLVVVLIVVLVVLVVVVLIVTGWRRRC